MQWAYNYNTKHTNHIITTFRHRLKKQFFYIPYGDQHTNAPGLDFDSCAMQTIYILIYLLTDLRRMESKCQ